MTASALIPVAGLFVWLAIVLWSGIPLRRRLAELGDREARRAALWWGLQVGIGLAIVLAVGVSLAFSPEHAPPLGPLLLDMAAAGVGLLSGLMMGFWVYFQRARE